MIEISPLQLMERIQSIRTAERLELIPKGYSTHLKYKVVRCNGTNWLLRLSPLDHHERMQSEFNIIEALRGYDVQSPEPIEIGCLDDLGLSYYILTYIEGSDAREVLPQLPEVVQYQIGVNAGQDLRRMHKFQAPVGMPSWSERCMQKHNKYVEAYRICGVTLKHDESIFSFVEENTVFTLDRPSVFQHDDFHVGNIIVNDKNYSGVIDFNRFDWGDPIHDFAKVAMFSCEVSVPFSMGQIEGYFQGGTMPNKFWKLYALYVAMMMISSVVWTLRVIPRELEEMLERIHRVMDDHDNFQSMRPRWFQKSDDCDGKYGNE